jgi:excisionase family DNA binding protein
MTKLSSSNLLGRKGAAEYIGVQPGTLDNWASTRRYGLKFIKVGRLAKYRKEDLDEFLSRRTVNVEEGEK